MLKETGYGICFAVVVRKMNGNPRKDACSCITMPVVRFGGTSKNLINDSDIEFNPLPLFDGYKLCNNIFSKVGKYFVTRDIELVASANPAFNYHLCYEVHNFQFNNLDLFAD